MTWDRDIPPPTKAPRWDFASAEVGCSMAFGNREEAVKFAGALRKWARANRKLWGALIGDVERYPIGHSLVDGTQWRVWIVEKRERKSESQKIIDKHIPAMEKVLSRMHAEQRVEEQKLIEAFHTPPSTETDDDIMLSVDTRKGASVTIGKQPEPQPVEVVDEITPTGRRKRKGKE
jgi:hypothetical protein